MKWRLVVLLVVLVAGIGIALTTIPLPESKDPDVSEPAQPDSSTPPGDR